MADLTKPPVKLATVPKGTPTHKSWYVERSQVMEAVLEALAGDGRGILVGLVGAGGSGKTTAASEIVRNSEVRKVFSDGVVWLSVNQGAKERLPSLMLQLARMVLEDIRGSVGHHLVAGDDGAAYVKQCMDKGHGGKGLKCLVVADNVWDKEVLSKLLETGMSVLLSTRDEGLVTDALGKAVRIDELSAADAESVLRRAAELPPGVRLPDDAVDLVELCGRMAMDLAFVGRWSTVRGRHDRAAWSDAAGKVREEIGKVRGASMSDNVDDVREKRRKAILRAGFEDLAIGSDDERVQRLYLSLAVLPDGHAFTVKDAAVLLYDRTPSLEDEASVGGVVDILERWSVISSIQGRFRMHDAHSGFAREGLMDRGDVRRLAVKRWVRFISSLEALKSVNVYALKGLWLAVERVGGDGWVKTRPYVKALGAMDESDPLLRESIEAVAIFQEVQEDWERTSSLWRRLLEVERNELGADHPYVLNTYKALADCADRLGDAEDAANWRKKEREGLPLAMARMNLKDGSDLEAGFSSADGLGSLAWTMLRLTPDTRDEAEKLLRRCLEIEESEVGQDDAKVGITLLLLGVCVRQVGRLAEAEDLLRRSLRIHETKPDPEDLKVACALHELGKCVREAGRLGEAEELLRRCLGIREAKLGSEDVAVAGTLQSLGICVREEGRLEEAEELLWLGVDILEAKLGPDDTSVANTLHDIVVVCIREAGRLNEAEDLLRRCLNIEEVNLGAEDARFANTLHSLGVCVREAGRMEEAEEILGRCLRTKEANLGREDVWVASTLQELSVCARESGRLGEAEELLRRCLEILEANLGPENVEVANVLHSLGLCVLKEGRLGTAEGLFRHCLIIREAILGQEDIEVAHTLHDLSDCVKDSGRLEEAEELLRRCLDIVESSGASAMCR